MKHRNGRNLLNTKYNIKNTCSHTIVDIAMLVNIKKTKRIRKVTAYSSQKHTIVTVKAKTTKKVNNCVECSRNRTRTIFTIIQVRLNHIFHFFFFYIQFCQISDDGK